MIVSNLKKPKKPIIPSPPEKYLANKRHIASINFSEISSFTLSSLIKTIQRVIPTDVKLEDLLFEFENTDDYYDYGLDSLVIYDTKSNAENPYYHIQYSKYTKALEKYNKKLEEYEKKLKSYEEEQQLLKQIKANIPIKQVIK